MIFDSHMHVGSFESLFGVSLDRDGIEKLMYEHGISGGVVFYPDHEYVREVVESIPGLYALYWGNPRLPGYVEELREFLDHPKFIGLKLHPLIDGNPMLNIYEMLKTRVVLKEGKVVIDKR